MIVGFSLLTSKSGVTVCFVYFSCIFSGEVLCLISLLTSSITVVVVASEWVEWLPALLFVPYSPHLFRCGFWIMHGKACYDVSILPFISSIDWLNLYLHIFNLFLYLYGVVDYIQYTSTSYDKWLDSSFLEVFLILTLLELLTHPLLYSPYIGYSMSFLQFFPASTFRRVLSGTIIIGR